jgi:hypothetical protein
MEMGPINCNVQTFNYKINVWCFREKSLRFDPDTGEAINEGEAAYFLINQDEHAKESNSAETR